MGALSKEKINDRKLQGTVGPELWKDQVPPVRCRLAVPGTKDTEAGKLS